jgi:hypothetical protein
MQDSVRQGSTLCTVDLRIITEGAKYTPTGGGRVLRSHRRYYCKGAEVPEVAPACGCAVLLGDRGGGRGEVGSPPTWLCRAPSEPSTRIPNPRKAATLDARDRGEDIGSCEI